MAKSPGLLFFTAEEILEEKITMTKGLLTLLFASVLALPISVAMSAQETPAKTKAAKEASWDGTVIRRRALGAARSPSLTMPVTARKR